MHTRWEEKKYISMLLRSLAIIYFAGIREPLSICWVLKQLLSACSHILLSIGNGGTNHILEDKIFVNDAQDYFSTKSSTSSCQSFTVIYILNIALCIQDSMHRRDANWCGVFIHLILCAIESNKKAPCCSVCSQSKHLGAKSEALIPMLHVSVCIL